MKRINLLPTANAATETFTLHGFWRNYFVLSAIVLPVAAGIAWSMQERVREFEQELPRAERLLASLEPQYQHFEALVQERNTVKKTVSELQREIREELSPSLVEGANVSSQLMEITALLPRHAWLRSFDSRLQERRFLLEVSAESESSMRQFLTEGLQRRFGQDSVTVNSVRHERNDRPEILFEVEVRLNGQAEESVPDEGETG